MSSELPNPESNGLPEQQPSEIVEDSLVEHCVSSTEIANDPNRLSDNPLADDKADALSYLHPTSLMFDLLAHGKTYLIPASFGLWGAAKGDMTLLIISALIFIPAFLVSVIRYFTYRYCIENDQLIVRQGLIFRNVRTVPVSRIQNIDFVQNPLHRMLHVAEVKVETASGTKPEATLRVLSLAKMESLRDAVFGGAQNKPTPVLGSSGMVNSGLTEFPHPAVASVAHDANLNNHVVDRQEPEVVTLMEIPLAWLVKAGLASNRGMIIISVLFGLYFQFSNRRTFFSLESFQGLLPDQASTTFIVAAAIGGVIVVLLLLRLVGIGWFILRFYNYRLVRRGDDLRISCGLVTKVSATVPRQRVQFISIHRNLIMRMFGLASIRIETAGGAGKQGENATESVSKRWFIPVMPEEKVSELLSSIRPGLDLDETKLDFKPLAQKAGRRLSRLAIIQAVILAGAGLAVVRPWGFMFGVVALPLLLMWAIKKSKAMRYARTENGVVYRSGVLIHKTSVTFFEKIQTLQVDQSPFDRRWKMARLSVDTAAAGPADHRIQIPYLDEDFAREELQLLRSKTGQQQPVFG